MITHVLEGSMEIFKMYNVGCHELLIIISSMYDENKYRCIRQADSTDQQ